MASDLYRIKPLVWEEPSSNWPFARTVVGLINIYKRCDKKGWDVLPIVDSCDVVAITKTSKAAKSAAEKWYRERLLTALEKVDE